MNRIRFKMFAVSMAAVFVAFGCGNSNPGGGGTGETLAPDQTLRFPIQDDIQTLDPGHVSSAVDITFTQEMYTGLYKFDNTNKIVNSIATGPPDISSDGKTYTFHMRKDVKFSNGDPVKAADVIYSWNRAAALNDAYATVFDPVVGGPDTEAGKTKTMSGLTAPDDYTVKAVLSDTAGYWLTELALWTADVVDQKAVTAGGEDKWWQSPTTAIGTGAYKMTARTPKASMEFQPVKNWWGGSTGALTKVSVTIGEDQASQVKKFESGGYDLVGMANDPPGPDDILRYKNDPTKSKLENIYPASRTSWVSFNLVQGPFATKAGLKPGDPTNTAGGADAGKDGRTAFAQAINRDQLIDVACAHAATCAAAIGGGISKGLIGYVGDGKDPLAKFDAAGAKSTYQKWDPDGSKAKGLTALYNASASNKTYWENLQSQWKANLGVQVDLKTVDFPTLIKQRQNNQAGPITRGSWGADYNHPQDWFDNLWTCAEAPVGKGSQGQFYCNQAMDTLVHQADAKPIDQATPDYVKAGQMMIDDAVQANTTYGTQTYFTQTYVKGSGYGGLYDFYWEGIRLLKH